MKAEDLVRAVAEAEPAELPALVGAFAQAQAVALARLTAPRPAEGARPMIRPEDAAERLCIPPSKVYSLLRSRQLQGVKVGKYWTIPADALDRYIRQREAACLSFNESSRLLP
jgi:excisionase family DNA binding protein